MLKNKLTIVVLALVIASMVTGCGNTPPQGGVIKQAVIGNPDMLNPLLTTDASALKIYDYIFEGLLRYDENMQLVGQLAEDWEFSSDDLEWTFFLRKDVTWHDGEPFTARDVEFTFSTLAFAQDYPGTRTEEFSILKDVEVLDDHSIRFILSSPSGPFLGQLTQSIMPRHIYDPSVATGSDKISIGKLAEHPRNWKPVGTGPFKFGVWVKDQYITVERNENYYGDPTYLQSVQFNFFPDVKDAVSALENGKIDMVEAIPYDLAEEVEPRLAETHTFFHYPELGCEFLAFNFRPGAFGRGRINPWLNTGVRQAVALALDREGMIQELLSGRGVLVDSSVPMGSWAYSLDAADSYLFDPERAEELLDQAGWKRATDSWRYNGGQRLLFKLTIRGDIDFHRELADIIKDNLEAIGIQVEISPVSWSKLFVDHVYTGDFEMILMGMSLDSDPDVYNYFHSSAISQGVNFGAYSNPEMDQILRLGRTTVSPDSRRGVYADMQRLQSRELPYVFLFSRELTAIAAEDIGGIVPSPLGLRWPERWYLSEE